MRAHHLIRGTLIGMAILPAYWLATLHAIAADSLAPAALGVLIMGMVGAAAGYCWENVAWLFDFSLPTGFLPPGNSRGQRSGSLSDPVLDDLDCVGSLRDENRDCLKDDDHSYSNKQDKLRMNFSFDWRDEYSSPASRDKDVFGKD